MAVRTSPAAYLSTRCFLSLADCVIAEHIVVARGCVIAEQVRDREVVETYAPARGEVEPTADARAQAAAVPGRPASDLGAVLAADRQARAASERHIQERIR